MEFIYCAFCKHGRKAYTKRHADIKDIGWCLLLSLLAMLSLWQALHLGVVVIFSLFLIGTEVSVHFRRRLSMDCPHCGFDPVLYVKSPKMAEAKVKNILDEKKMSVDFYLSSKNPFEHLPKKIAKEGSKIEESRGSRP